MSSTFPVASGKQLGYHPQQVDAFLLRARQSFEQAVPEDQLLTAREIRATAFALKRKGYAARFVDAAMDRLEEVFFERERRATIAAYGEDAWWASTQQQLSEVRARLARPRGKRFKRRGFFASGYRIAEVDAFLDRVQSMLSGSVALTTTDIRGAVFHTQWRGYSEPQVDALLDAVIEILLSTR